MDVSTVLASIRQSIDDEELISITYELEDFSERKLYHQLTLSLENFYKIANEDLKVQIFNQFISTLTKKLNSYKVTDFLLKSFENNQQECLNKLIKLQSEIESSEDENAKIYINLQISRFYILLNDFEEANKILDALDNKFTMINNEFNSKINNAYYSTKCQYFKSKDNYNSFYTNGLLYLSTLNELNETQDVEVNKAKELEFAFDLSISALLGDKIYNFGELILNNILENLNNSPYQWLYDLIINLNNGDIKNFGENLTISFDKFPKLKQFQSFLNQKIIIMSLVELISVKSILNKKLSFQEISEFTSTDLNDVEHLIIKCFSLNLFSGSIDQINKTLTISYLQPRILNLNQIKTLHSHLKQWDEKVLNLSNDVHKNGGSLWIDT